MKPYKAFAAGLLLVSATALGQSNRQSPTKDSPYFASISSKSEEYVQKATDNYTLLLTSLNDGVVESSMAHLTYLYMGAPERDLKKARIIIKNLAESGRTPVIRYKARLSMMVFESPELFADGVNAASNDGDQFFLEIAAKVQKNLLGHII